MIRTLARLTRPRLALVNGIAAAGGYVLFPGGADWLVLAAVLSGVALLAAGGSALNQVMEQDIDRLMARTGRRPLPRGELAPATAAVIGGVCVVAGLPVLAVAGGLLPPLLGAGALVWYLGLYTPLKRRTPFALPVGAVCGAVPPVVGWCAAGGSPTDFRVILLAGLLYLWQIPHFWLFQRRYADEYRKAGIPHFGAGPQGTCYFRLWVVALVAVAMLLPAFGIIGRQVAFWYALFLVPLLILSGGCSGTAFFSYLNLFPVMVTSILFVQK